MNAPTAAVRTDEFPPRTHVRELCLQRENAGYAAALCLTRATPPELSPWAPHLLHPSERARAATFRAERRRDGFLGGRIAAKLALQRLRPGLDGAGTCIFTGVFGQPIVEGPAAAGLQVTISHAEGLAGAVAFPEAHPVGFDLERIRPELEATIRSQLTSREHALLPGLPFDPATGCTLLWTIKESLAKVLKCGLMTPLSILELESLDASGPTVVATFAHFGQYRTESIVGSECVLSLALPRNTAMELAMPAGWL